MILLLISLLGITEASDNCQVSDLERFKNNNTLTSPTDEVEANNYVTLYCPPDYRLGTTSSYANESTVIQCISVVTSSGTLSGFDTTLMNSDGSIPSEYQCYAYPTLVSAAPDGANLIKVTITLPDSDSDMEQLEASATGSKTGDIFTCNISTLNTTNECHITTNGTSEVYSVNVTLTYTSPASLSYQAVNSSDTSQVLYLSSYAGPSALDTSSATITSAGTTNITLTLPDSVVDAASDDVTYTLNIHDSETGQTVASKTLDIDSLKSPGQTFGDLALDVNTAYTASVTSSLEAGEGGTSAGISFTTSYLYEKPTVSTHTSGLDTNLFTITLGSTTSDLNVSINGVTYLLTFSGGRAEQEISSLSGGVTYSYSVMVVSGAGDQLSDTATVVFTQEVMCTIPGVSNGTVVPAAGSLVNGGVTYNVTCEEGYQLLNGTVQSGSCDGDSGNFVDPSPSCESVTCTVPTISNGETAPSATGNYNTTYTVTCNDGYQLLDNVGESGNCQENGTFGSPTPSCEETDSEKEDTVTSNDTVRIVVWVIVVIILIIIIVLVCLLVVIRARKKKEEKDKVYENKAHEEGTTSF